MTEVKIFNKAQIKKTLRIEISLDRINLIEKIPNEIITKDINCIIFPKEPLPNPRHTADKYFIIPAPAPPRTIPRAIFSISKYLSPKTK